MNSPLPDSPVIKLDFGGGQSKVVELKPQHDPRWPLLQWLLLIVLVLAGHLAAIFIFGDYHLPAVREVKHVPHVRMVDNAGELVRLDDPTLFVRPHAGDFAVQRLQLKPPAFRWTEAPRLLALPEQALGAVFNEFLKTNAFAAYQPDFKPKPVFNSPDVSPEPAFAERSAVQVDGDLAQRRMLNDLNLPDWPYADVIAPTKVQVLVDAGGDVVSAILLPSNGTARADRYDVADQRALELARSARFAPGAGLTVGTLTFNWRTVPPPAPAPAPAP